MSKHSRGVERHGPPPVPAAILGMHTLMSSQQYYQALGSSSIVNKEGLNSEYTALVPSLGRPPLPPATRRPGSEGVPVLLASAAHSCSLAQRRRFKFLCSQIDPPSPFPLLGFVSCSCRTSPSSCDKNVLLYFLLKVLEVCLLYSTSCSPWSPCVGVVWDEIRLSFLMPLPRGQSCSVQSPSLRRWLGLHHEHEFLHIHTGLSPGASFVP